MKKMILVLVASISVASCLFITSCSRKGFATAPPMAASDTSFVPFTKLLKDRLEHDGVDIKKIQFYTNQKLVLKHATGVEKGQVKSGIIMIDNSQSVNQITIPAWTPGVCEKVDGDMLKISFDAPGKAIEFGALYANTTFILVGTNYHNGVVDITYDNQPYTAQCATCGNAGDVKLFVRKNQAYKSDDVNRVVMGRKVN
jgi:hypothetical protein